MKKKLNWKIKKNLKDYSKEFDDEDAALSNKASTEVQEKRRAQLSAYKSFMVRFDSLKEKEVAERISLYGFDPYAMDDYGDSDEQVVEEIIELVEEVVEE